MKGKVILFSSVALLMVFAVAPLMASPASACRIVPASVTVNGPAAWTKIGTVTTLPSGFIIYSGFGLEVPNLLTIGTGAHAIGYDTLSVSTMSGVWNPNTKIGHFFFDGEWYVLGSPTDGFRYCSCSFVITEYNYNPETESYSFATVQVVAQGFGIFAGDTLVMHYAGTNTFEPWSGFVIIR